FSPAGSNDEHGLAERHGGCSVCVASIARRIRRVDYRTQGCAQHVDGTAVRLGVRAKTTLDLPVLVCARVDGETHACDIAVHSSSARLLASPARPTAI